MTDREPTETKVHRAVRLTLSLIELGERPEGAGPFDPLPREEWVIFDTNSDLMHLAAYVSDDMGISYPMGGDPRPGRFPDPMAMPMSGGRFLVMRVEAIHLPDEWPDPDEDEEGED